MNSKTLSLGASALKGAIISAPLSAQAEISSLILPLLVKGGDARKHLSDIATPLRRLAKEYGYKVQAVSQVIGGKLMLVAFKFIQIIKEQVKPAPKYSEYCTRLQNQMKDLGITKGEVVKTVIKSKAQKLAEAVDMAASVVNKIKMKGIQLLKSLKNLDKNGFARI